MTQLGQGGIQVARWLEAENDPRLTGIVRILTMLSKGAYR